MSLEKRIHYLFYSGSFLKTLRENKIFINSNVFIKRLQINT